VEIVIDFPGGAKVDAHIGSHTVHTDQPAQGGGEDSAPTPFAVFFRPLAHARGFMRWAFAVSAG